MTLDEIEIAIVLEKKEDGHVAMRAKVRGVTKSKRLAKVADELFEYIGKFNPSGSDGKPMGRVVDSTRGSGPASN